MNQRIDWKALIGRLAPRWKSLPDLAGKIGASAQTLNHYRYSDVEPSYQKGETLVDLYRQQFGEEPPRVSSRVPVQASGSTHSSTTHP